MKSWVLAACLICAGAIAACADEEGGTGGNGGRGGEGGKNGSSSSTGGEGGKGGGGGSGGGEGGEGKGGEGKGGEGGEGGSQTSSSSTGMPTCSELHSECGMENNDGCYACAAAKDGPCHSVVQECVDDLDCLTLFACIDGCADKEDPETCTTNCREQHAEVTEKLDAMYQCILCDVCADSCKTESESYCPAP